MATLAELIARAYRQENLTAAGQGLTTVQLDEGVGIFNDIWRQMLGTTAGEKLGDWPVPPGPTSPVYADYPLVPRAQSLPTDVYPYPQQNYNLVTNLSAPQTVYFQQNPADGARMGLTNVGASYATQPLTINANGRLIEGAATLVLSAATATPLLWFYRADLSDWKRVATLVSTDTSPLPEDFDAFWRCAIAIELCPRFGKDPKSVTVKTHREGKAKIVGRYNQTMPSAVDPYNVWRMPYQGFGPGVWGGGVPFGN